MAVVEPSVVQAFSNVSLFADLKKRQLTSVVEVARKIVHAPGHEVASEGRGALAFHIVAEGNATVAIGGKGRRTLYPGDSFGEISMIDGLPRSATVTAGSAGLTTYALNRSQFLALLDSDKAIARAVMVALCGRIRASETAI